MLATLISWEGDLPRDRYQKHRSNLEIMFTILRYVAREGEAKKTHILYHAGLNSRSLERFLKKLVQSDLLKIAKNGGNIFYTITPRGRRTLVIMSRLITLLSSEKEVLKDIEKVVNGLDGAKVEVPGAITGASGLTHSFDMVIHRGKNGKVVAKIIDLEALLEEAVDEFSRFCIAVMDTSAKGIVFAPSHMLPRIRTLANSLQSASSELSIEVVGYGNDDELKHVVRTATLSRLRHVEDQRKEA